MKASLLLRPSISAISLLAVNAIGASFDCIKSTTWVEKAVCADPGLSELDAQLAREYKEAQARVANPKGIQAAQLNWLNETRNRCQDNNCLRRSYTERLKALQVEAPSMTNEYTHYQSERVIASGPFLFEFTPDPSAEDFVVEVRNKPDNRIIQIIHDGNSADHNLADQAESVRVEDFNFDGYPDFSVFDTAGNVQIFHKVYLFDSRRMKFVLNEKLSELPCLEVDPKNRTVTGACFHGSACNNWTETYSYRRGTLIMQESEGTECPEPAAGDAQHAYYYSFHTRRLHDRLVTTKACRLDTEGGRSQEVPMENCAAPKRPGQ